ncbi:hypothetical protein ACEWY4_013332 [Coilia grayii]|uniref:Plakophilin 1b n=1 Tax=Coilia grayii TaxID=363190 RepID=A0ABD1JW35_9TELE
MASDPFRSATSIEHVGDTSLAIPTDLTVISAQQRVMDQVNTLRRTATSTKSNSSVIDGNGSTRLSCHAKMQFENKLLSSSSFSSSSSQRALGRMSHTLSRVSAARRTNSTLSYRVQSSSNTWADRSKVQRKSSSSSSSKTLGHHYRIQREGLSGSSVPNLTSHSMIQPSRAQVLSQARQNQGLTLQNRLTQSFVLSPQMVMHTSPPMPILQTQDHSMGFNTSPTSLCKVPIRLSVEGKNVAVSMTEAIQFLSSPAERLQLFAASYIQHSTYTDDKARQQVFQLKGIPPLVALLQSPNPLVQQVASAALRNLVYRNHGNKEEVGHCGGVAQVAQLLKDNQSAEIQKHLTGLLWNLSSADSLKADLMKSSLLTLTESVVVPYVSNNLNNDVDTEVFFNATACLRNLSSAKQVHRQTMRKTSGLVDVLVLYMFTCVDEEKFNDKSLENCVCILHNLTYQLQDECPQLFSRMKALCSSSKAHTAGPISCFSPRSHGGQQEGCIFDYPMLEDNTPSGCAWLLHSKLLEAYLSVLRQSENQATLEACCGALQNLTASEGTVSAVLSQTIVQKLSGVPAITPLLKCDDVSLRCSAVGLLGNFSQHPPLHRIIACKALVPLIDFISAGVPSLTEDRSELDETMATACLTTHALMTAEQKMSKGLLSNGLINSLNNMSNNGNMEKSSKAAAFLLYSLWKQKDFQSSLRKRGMQKRAFVNEVTTAAHKSMVVID